MASKTRDELKESFGPVLDDDDLMEECVQMCTLFNLSGDDLFFKWEAFSYGSNSKDRVISNLDIEGARELHASLKRAQAAQAAAPVSTPKNAKIKTLPKSLGRSFLGGSASMLSSPLAASPTTSRLAQQPRIAPLDIKPSVYTPKAKFTPPTNLADYDYQYMYEKLSERAEILDELIDDMAERVKNFYQIEDIGDPASMSETDTVVVGRICSDSEEKPNESSLLLESSRNLGSGKRVVLRFSPECSLRSEIPRRPSFNFFSGQIVALKGRNGNGLNFVVSEILAVPRLLPQALSQRTNISDDGRTELFVACGPYSSDRDLEYGPWMKLIPRIQRIKPSVLILLGPFVDSNNELIKKGAVTQNPTAYFQQHIASRLEEIYAEVPGISIFLVPSPRDIIHDHFAFPQNVLDKTRLGLSANVFVLPNPCAFTVNGINVGVSSVDILSQLGAQQYAKPLQEPSSKHLDGVQLLGLQILEQRSFYPLFPVPAKESANVNLDISHSHLLHLDVAPDVLIVPSRLKSGHRIVDRTVVVNSGFLTRGANPDTFARIVVPSLGSIQITGSPDVPVDSKDSMVLDGVANEPKGEERTDLPENITVEIVKLD